jgi:16S rRNA processing protein RimM
LKEYINIGKFVAPYGVNGELILQHELGKKTSLKGLQAIFLEEHKGSFLPWFISATRIKSEKEIYIKLEGVDSREAAFPLLRKKVWMTASEHQKYAAKSSPSGLLGFTIISNGESLGEILEVIEQPQQLVCRLEINGREVLIPLHEESLRKIDRAQKKVWVELPEGLLEIYLE